MFVIKNKMNNKKKDYVHTLSDSVPAIKKRSEKKTKKY